MTAAITDQLPATLSELGVDKWSAEARMMLIEELECSLIDESRFLSKADERKLPVGTEDLGIDDWKLEDKENLVRHLQCSLEGLAAPGEALPKSLAELGIDRWSKEERSILQIVIEQSVAREKEMSPEEKAFIDERLDRDYDPKRDGKTWDEVAASLNDRFPWLKT